MSRWLYFLVALAVFILDRVSKMIVEARLPLHQSQTVIEGFFDLTHTRNTGVAFGFFANSESSWMPQLLTLISGIALLVILAFSLRNSSRNWKLQLGLMLVLGGAAGNLYDRLLHGYVTDFIEMYYRSYHWPTFNMADSSISIGIGLLLLETLTQQAHPDASEVR
jgi:signal peptidase II